MFFVFLSLLIGGKICVSEEELRAYYSSTTCVRFICSCCVNNVGAEEKEGKGKESYVEESIPKVRG